MKIIWVIVTKRYSSKLIPPFFLKNHPMRKILLKTLLFDAILKLYANAQVERSRRTR
ncbi:MAG: hypothetical protein RLZZ506_71 [Bacteroidota bacterium]